jgi:hypothetical protein
MAAGPWRSDGLEASRRSMAVEPALECRPGPPAGPAGTTSGAGGIRSPGPRGVTEPGDASYFWNYEGGWVTRTTLVLDNSVVDGNGVGVRLAAGCFPDCPVDTVLYLTNDSCTIADNLADGVALGLPGIQAAATIGNNVFAGNAGHGVRDADPAPASAEPAIHRNTFWRNALGPWLRGVAADASNEVADPRLVDPAAGDFRLQPASPCIDAGGGGGRDFAGTLRPLDGDGDGLAIRDRGAIESPTAAPVALRRAIAARLVPLTPAKEQVFPFGPGNPLTPVLLPAFTAGAVDPDLGILDDPRAQLAFYQLDRDGYRLAAVKDVVARTVRFEHR